GLGARGPGGRGLQLHAGTEAQLPDRRAGGRALARAAELGRADVRRERPGQPGRRGRAAGGPARPRPQPHADPATAGSAVPQARLGLHRRWVATPGSVRRSARSIGIMGCRAMRPRVVLTGPRSARAAVPPTSWWDLTWPGSQPESTSSVATATGTG